MRNEYFICSRTAPPVKIDIGIDRPVEDAEITYFIRGFRLLEQHYHLEDCTVCFAWSSVVALPRLGPDVVAVIYGDEHCRVPAYAGKVRAVIKCHGFFPVARPRLRPLRLAQIEAVEFLRNLALWTPAGWRWLLSREIRRKCTVVPVGYGKPTTIPPVPFTRRRYLTSFIGSVTQPRGLRRLLGTPKSYCRSALLRQMRILAEQYGPGRVRTGVTETFQQSIGSTAEDYFSVMSQSQICVAPRGTAHETLRLFEGLRFGCIVVADRLPRHGFYRDSPILEVRDWSELPPLVHRLQADPDHMLRLSEASLRWWNEVLDERSLARMSADALGLLPGPARRSADQAADSVRNGSHSLSGGDGASAWEPRCRA